MRRLRDGLARKYDGGPVQVFMPPNGATVAVGYKETRLVKAVASVVSVDTQCLRLVLSHRISLLVCIGVNDASAHR